MSINRHNCEARFLDYYEQTLSPVEVAEVLFFLEENPDLKKVFESYEVIHLEHEKINFPNKESLKKKYSAEEIGAILSSDINRTNREQFFIANAEGIISSYQKEKLNLFLLQYPELKKEYELFLQCKLSAEKIFYEGKESLKKDLITTQNKEEYYIRAIENELSAFEQKELTLFLSKNPAYKQELELFKKTILASETIYFPQKSSLKKRDRKPILVPVFSQRITYYAAAATILLLAGLFFFFRNNDNTNKQLFADKTNQGNTTTINLNKENIENPAQENKQNAVLQEKEIKNTNRQRPRGKQIIVKEIPVSNKSEIKEEKTQRQSILSEDLAEEKRITQKEEPQLPTMKEETISAQSNNVPEEKATVLNQDKLAAAVKKQRNNANDYQTLSAFVTKKVRSLLGVKNTNPCAESDKLGWWDLAMAAKNQVQKITGTKAIDVNKVCDGTGNKVEYVFAAGNFEFSKSAAK